MVDVKVILKRQRSPITNNLVCAAIMISLVSVATSIPRVETITVDGDKLWEVDFKGVDGGDYAVFAQPVTADGLPVCDAIRDTCTVPTIIDTATVQGGDTATAEMQWLPSGFGFAFS
jgi:hypothetical protein